MKTKKCIRAAILYGVCGIVCLFNFTVMYPFFIIFVFLVIFNVYTAIKHVDDKPNPLEEKYKHGQSQRKQKKADGERITEEKKKVLKSDYKKRLQQIEADFSDDWYDSSDEIETDDNEDIDAEDTTEE